MIVYSREEEVVFVSRPNAHRDVCIHHCRTIYKCISLVNISLSPQTRKILCVDPGISPLKGSHCQQTGSLYMWFAPPYLRQRMERHEGIFSQSPLSTTLTVDTGIEMCGIYSMSFTVTSSRVEINMYHRG